MGNNSVLLSILNNEGLTEEEKTVLLKMLAHQVLDEKKEEYSSNNSSSREKLIIENRKKAEEHRKRLERINRNSEINEKVKILSHLKNKMGENQFSEEYLNSISGFELDSIYEDCKRTMPSFMKAAIEELKKEQENKIETPEAEVRQPVNESEEEKKEVFEPLRLEGPVLENENNQDEVVPEVKDNTNPLSKMTSDERGYLDKLKKIAEEQGVSLEEAEAIYKNKKEAEPVAEEESSQLVFKDPVEKEIGEAETMIAANKAPETPVVKPEGEPVIPNKSNEDKAPESISYEYDDNGIVGNISNNENKEPSVGMPNDELVDSSTNGNDDIEKKLVNESDSDILSEAGTFDDFNDNKAPSKVKAIATKPIELFKKTIFRGFECLKNVFNRKNMQASSIEDDENIIDANSPESDNKTFRANTIMSTNDTNFKEVADEVVNVDDTTYKKEMNR